MAASPAGGMLTQPLRDALDRAQTQVNALVLGKAHEVRLAFVALLSDGHILIEDLPGLGKTTLARAMAATLGLDFQRMQFTSDLLPSDIIGVSIFHSFNYDRDYYIPADEVSHEEGERTRRLAATPALAGGMN